MNNKYKRINNCAKSVTLTALAVFSMNVFSADPWPGESWENALKLGSLEDAFSNGDISGAHWNSNTQTLWVSDNKEEKIWSLVESNSNFSVDKSFEISGDLEGITQAMDDSVLYVMDEDRYILSVDTPSGNNITTWEIENDLPSSGDDGKDGPEGITFVPNAWLSTSGFVDDNGNTYTASRYDFGGIFLVAHQNGGAIYAFDLASNGSYNFIGQYDTARSESSGLAFDRSTGILYISHNVDGNTLETTNLQSTSNGDHREFVTQNEFTAPNESNLEGFALKPAINADKSLNDVWAFYTDDDGNTDDGNAILVFKSLPSSLTVTAGNNQTANANSAVAVSPEVQLTDGFENTLSDIDVSFTVTQGNGLVAGNNTTTDTNGSSSLQSWVLGASGAQEVTAQTGSISAVINASITGDSQVPTEVTATSSGDDADNVAANVLDDIPATRWSASGEQWLQLNLGSTQTVSGVSFSFYRGDTRSALFDIETSLDGDNWTIQLDTIYSSGNSVEAEEFYFTNSTDAQFVRYVGHGNDSSSSSSARWNSLTEAKILTRDNPDGGETENETETETGSGTIENTPITTLSIASFSAEQEKNPASNIFDGDTSNTSGSRWSAQGLQGNSQWVVIDMGENYVLSQVTVFPYLNRAYQYEVQISESANSNFTSIVDRTNNTEGNSSLTDVIENTTSGRYLRIEIQGANDYSGNWASINEIQIEGHKE